MNTNQRIGICSISIITLTSFTDCALIKGDLEETFLKTSIRTSNLCAIRADDGEVHQIVSEMISSLDAIAKEDIRGFQLAAMLDPTLSGPTTDANSIAFTLGEPAYQLLRETILRRHTGNLVKPAHQAISFKQVSIHGVSYATCSSHAFRDSNIMFRLHDVSLHTQELHKAGVIDAIFQHTHGGLKSFYLIVREYLPMDPTSGCMDPFWQYGFAGGYLCNRQPTTLHVLELNQVTSHFTLTEMQQEGYQHLIHVTGSYHLHHVFSTVAVRHLDQLP